MIATNRILDLRDIGVAIALLSRLPVPVDAEFARKRGAAAAWAYPLAGLLVAAMAGAIGWGALALGLPVPLAAGLALGTQICLTGALHEDGLADAADGLWGGWSRDRRLEIMKDSRIGSYGVIALILSTGLRWSALAALGPAMVAAMAAAAPLSRAAMVAVMGLLPNARPGGISASVGRPRPITCWIAIAIAGAAALAIAGTAGLWLFLAAIPAAAAAATIARAKIGGQTGDILGAAQQLTELACLSAATLLLAG